MHSKLFVIGNGFDLFHDIPSTYSDFRDYASAYEKPLYQALLDFYDSYNLWSDFENKLAYADMDKLHDQALQYLSALGEGNEGLYKEGNYIYELTKGVELITTGLRKGFNHWIQSLYNPILAAKNILNLPSDAQYITFNYTQTLEIVYKIPPSKIVYLHGVVYDECSEIVLGHATHPSELQKENPLGNEEIEDGDYRASQARELFNSSYSVHFKDVSEVISEKDIFFNSLSNIGHVYILGHSLSEIDIEYFQVIAAKIRKDAVWTVSYFTDYEKSRHFHTLRTLGLKDEKIDLKKFDELIFD